MCQNLRFLRHNRKLKIVYARDVRLAVAACGLGGGFVGVIELLGRNQLAAPIPFFLLLPGMMAALLAPSSGGRAALWIVYGVSVGLYSGAAYLILRAIQLRRGSSARNTGVAVQ